MKHEGTENEDSEWNHRRFVVDNNNNNNSNDEEEESRFNPPKRGITEISHSFPLEPLQSHYLFCLYW